MTMASDRILEKIVTEFISNTCLVHRRLKQEDILSCVRCLETLPQKFRQAGEYVEYNYVPLAAGSTAEFYIEPMLSCIGDIDVMRHRSNQLAIPAGYTPPTQLPGEFDSRVEVYEIVNSEFPGYVYLWLCYLLTECVDDDKYSVVHRERLLKTNGNSCSEDSRHGPALEAKELFISFALSATDLGVRWAGSHRSVDHVFCMRCLLWPPQAADWPTRHRKYGWPDSATVDRVVSNGCDVVGVAHPQCREDEWLSKCQWRLSFSRAEIVLLNSWMPVQQIVYHMLRLFLKTTGLTDSAANNSGAGTLNNYHIKTLMLWACELKSRSWWTDDLNLVRICVELLHTLAVWLTDARCQHYFINNCNLFDQSRNSRHYYQVIANRLISISRALFCDWFIYSYIYECSKLCPSSVWSLLQERSSDMLYDGLHSIVRLQTAVSQIITRRLDVSRKLAFATMATAQCIVMVSVSRKSLTVRSCLWMTQQIAKISQDLHVFLTAVVFLHGACKTMQGLQGLLTDEMLDVLAATCLQLNDARRFLNARHSSVLSLSQAAMVMKVAANSSRSTVQLIETELSKAYLHRALRCKDSNTNSIYCLVTVYLSVLYYTTGQYQTAIDFCAMVTRLQDHSQCSSHVVQGELLPRIDDQVDNILGVAVLYQFILAAALDEEQERRHVSVFTTELFAHYLLINYLSVAKCCQPPQTSLADEIQQYHNCFCSSEIFVTDVVLFRSTKYNRTRYPVSNDELLMPDRRDPKCSTLLELDTSKLVELLQQSAVEHFTTCRELETRDFDSFATPDFEALYAYKCGQYQHCAELSVRNVRTMIVHKCILYLFVPVFPTPELIQLMDDDIVSLVGLTALINQSSNNDRSLVVVMHQLSLSLYLMTQCQIKLRHSVTSLATTLDYVRLARFCSTQLFKYVFDFTGLNDRCTIRLLDQHVLKYVEQKISRYIYH